MPLNSNETVADADSAPRRLLLIDDDEELGELMAEFFASRGLSLETVSNSVRGLARALSGEHELLILDVMMPQLDGFEILRQVRKQNLLPVILLTARTTQADRVAGLDAGADDYLPKPFGPEELLARIRAILRRTRRKVQVELVQASGIVLCPTAREARCWGKLVSLTTLEFDILEQLVRSAGRVVTRDQLSATLHHRKASPFDRSLDVHVGHIRRKLGERGALIRTVRGVGYLLAAVEAGDGAD